MSTKKDYYEILGVPKNAGNEEIRTAYREAALKYHPDRAAEGKKKEAEERFKEISEAYAVLTDPQKRALYDQYGHSGVDQRYSSEDIFRGADFGSIFQDLSDSGLDEDIFQHIFGDLGFGIFGARHSAPIRHKFRITITLEEAATGVEKTISVPHLVPCTKCGGKGSVQRRVCPECQGEGSLTVRRQHKVKIPAGVETGSQMRMQDSHDILEIEVLPHHLFKRQKANLETEKKISLADAVLGGEVDVPTLFSKVKMKVPPGTQNGQIFRLKGQGMPHIDGKEKGDELVRVSIEIPTSLTSEQRKLFEAFAKSLLI